MHFELLLLVTGGRWTWRRGAWSRGLLNAGQICRFRWDSGQDSDQVWHTNMRPLFVAVACAEDTVENSRLCKLNSSLSKYLQQAAHGCGEEEHGEEDSHLKLS